ncbi:hypothetical protein ColLi_12140 [Colletotrichum liriopes]|uniref:Uncharacterized protein n=1 Tax=Colletotrichum liriopes TaxID=708192 RepID=A0AA37GYE0_9PEZI|nr:hypothetical protein ColLi_12140 [Colletotrichum liriopes]
MSSICSLQWELYRHKGRHRTLCDLFDVPVEACQDAISAAYLGRLQGLFPGMAHCLDAILNQGVQDHLGPGQQETPFPVPPACTSSDVELYVYKNPCALAFPRTRRRGSRVMEQ